MIFLVHERGIAMSSNPADKKLAAKIKDLELKLAAYEKGAAPQLISEEFRRLANRSRDMIFRYDLTTRQFLFANNTFREFYGMDVEGGREVTTKSVLLSLHPEDRDKVKKAQDESLAPGSTGGDMEYRQIRSDGSLHWMHDRWIVITDETGNPVIIEGIVRDITERKQGMAELKKQGLLPIEWVK
jgi:PAS domain S-box-containing protein